MRSFILTHGLRGRCGQTSAEQRRSSSGPEASFYKRYTELVETSVSYRKQTIGAHSNRYTKRGSFASALLARPS